MTDAPSQTRWPTPGRLWNAPLDPAAPERLPTLDGARGLAALVVVVSHCANEGIGSAILGFGFGKMGVHLFFLLSGFLMAYLYGDRPFSGAEVKRYAMHRASRVIPLFYVVALLSIWFGNNGAPIWFFDVPADQVPLTLLLLHGVDVMWTIPVEIHYYALFPVIWFMAGRFRNPYWWAGLFLFQLILVVLILQVTTDQTYVPYWLHFFFIGTLCGFLFRRHYSAVSAFGESRGADVFGWLILIVALFSPPGVRRELGVPLLPVFIDPVSAGVPILVFLACVGNWGPFRWLRLAPFVWVGSVSYGLYLVHKLVLYTILPTIVERDVAGYLAVAFIIAVSLGIAALSAQIFERPVQRFLNRLVRKPKPPVAETRPFAVDAAQSG